MESNRDMDSIERAEFLKQQLNTVNRAIGILRESKSSESQSRLLSTEKFAERDLSYILDSEKEQRTTCPHCFAEMVYSKLKKHLSQSCPEKLVICSEYGCGQQMTIRELKKHLAHDCTVARKRRLLATTSIIRKEEIAQLILKELLPNPAAKTTVKMKSPKKKANALSTAPLSSDNNTREVDGNNDKSVLYADKDNTGVGAEEIKENETVLVPRPDPHTVTCPNCSDKMRDIKLKDHLSEECRMRLVLCTNRYLGCDAEVPLAFLQKHLKNDCIVEKRKDEMIIKSNLRRELVVCVGCGSFIPLMLLRRHENDLCENRKVPCRNWCLGCPYMIRLKERHLHEKVDGLLKPRSCLYLDGGSSHILLGEDDIPPPWTIEFWIYRPSAKEAAKNHIRAAIRLQQEFLMKKAEEEEIRRLVELEQEKLVQLLSSFKKNDKSDYVLKVKEDATAALVELVGKYERAALLTMTAGLTLENTLDTAMSLISRLLLDGNAVTTLRACPPGVVSSNDVLLLSNKDDSNIDNQADKSNANQSNEGDTNEANKENLGGSTGSRKNSKSGISSIFGENEPGKKGKKKKLINRVMNEDGTFTDVYSTDESIDGDDGDDEANENDKEADADNDSKYSDYDEESQLTDPVDLQSIDEGFCKLVNTDVDDDELVGLSFKGEKEIQEKIQDDNSILGNENFDSKIPIIQSSDNISTETDTNATDIAKNVSPSDNVKISDQASNGNVSETIRDVLETGGNSVVSTDTNNKSILLDGQPKVALVDNPSGNTVTSGPGTAMKTNNQIMTEESKSTDNFEFPQFEGGEEDDFVQSALNEIEDVAKSWSEWKDDIMIMRQSLDDDQEELKNIREESGLVREGATRNSRITTNSKARVGSAGKANNVPETESERKAKQKEKDKLRRERKRLKKRAAQSDGKRLNDEMTWMYRTCVGTDILASTQKTVGAGAARICIDIGAVAGEASQQKIGIACADFEPVYFDARIPRQKWTHIALVCTKKPKNRIMLYSDGALLGATKDCAFNLPMNAIGATEQSFHGVLLDCRYWAKARSAVEIAKQDLHNLITLQEFSTKESDDKKSAKELKLKRGAKKLKVSAIMSAQAKPDNLIGWWTFEDGPQSKRVADVSGHRYKCLIDSTEHSPYRWLYADNVSVDLSRSQGRREDPPPLPIPSFRERNLCPFEIRRFKLAQRGRALMREVDCPLGCPVMIRKIDTRFHVQFECEFRRVSCRLPFCTAMFPLYDRGRHEATDCLLVKARDEILEQAKELNALVACKLCSEDIRQREMDFHLENECPHRIIVCPHENCDEEIQAQDLEYHTKHDCRSDAIQNRIWLIQRARMRHNYARPWGIEIPMQLNKQKQKEFDSNLSSARSSIMLSEDENMTMDSKSI